MNQQLNNILSLAGLGWVGWAAVLGRVGRLGRLGLWGCGWGSGWAGGNSLLRVAVGFQHLRTRSIEFKNIGDVGICF